MKVSVGYWGQIFSVAFVFFLNLDITSKKPLKEAKKKKNFFFLTRRPAGSRSSPRDGGRGVGLEAVSFFYARLLPRRT